MLASVPVSVFIIIAMAGFLLLSAVKFAKYSKISKHSRFELYPVPKEGSKRAEYGGSYLEEPEWWTKKRTIDRGTETVDIMKEMLFIKKLYDHQRSLWFPSFAFHMGIYVMFGWSILLLIAAFWHPTVFVLIVGIVGVIGFTTATIGALALLYRRITDVSYQVYTTPAEYFNLLLILAVLTTGAYTWLSVASPFAVAYNVFTLNVGELPIMVVIHLVLLGFMLIYIPLSKMGHYAGKFFSFRSVLWDNDPNTPGSKVDANVRESAATPPTHHWSAPHTQAKSTNEAEG